MTPSSSRLPPPRTPLLTADLLGPTRICARLPQLPHATAPGEDDGDAGEDDGRWTLTVDLAREAPARPRGRAQVPCHENRVPAIPFTCPPPGFPGRVRPESLGRPTP